MILIKKFHNLLFNNRYIFEKPETPPEVKTTNPEGSKGEVAANSTAKRQNLADKSAKETTAVEKTDQETPSGKIHQKYLEKIQALSEDSGEKDREKLKAAEIKDVRFNTRLLKEKADKEDEASQSSGLKEETQRRKE